MGQMGGYTVAVTKAVIVTSKLLYNATKCLEYFGIY